MAIKAIEELQRARTSQGTVLTIGTFDGVHRGHQYVIGRVVDYARKHSFQSGVITFRASPRETLRPDTPFYYLSDLEERLELLRALDVDVVVALTFDRDLAQLSAREFMSALREHLSLCHLIVGPDFALGHNREGTIPVLTSLGEELGFTVESLDAFGDAPERIRSTAIRAALAGPGDVDAAQRLLGRSYAVVGSVVRGHSRGKDLGFPTANVDVPRQRALPADGVYVTRAYLNGVPYFSVTNVGDNPTFGDAERTVETYILDFDREIYGEELKIEFLQRLRGEERFPDIDALVAQIRRDVEQTRQYFNE